MCVCVFAVCQMWWCCSSVPENNPMHRRLTNWGGDGKIEMDPDVWRVLSSDGKKKEDIWMYLTVLFFLISAALVFICCCCYLIAVVFGVFIGQGSRESLEWFTAQALRHTQTHTQLYVDNVGICSIWLSTVNTFLQRIVMESCCDFCNCRVTTPRVTNSQPATVAVTTGNCLPNWPKTQTKQYDNNNNCHRDLDSPRWVRWSLMSPQNTLWIIKRSKKRKSINSRIKSSIQKENLIIIKMSTCSFIVK